MNEQKRPRGLILSDRGWDKLQNALNSWDTLLDALIEKDLRKTFGQYNIANLQKLTKPLNNKKSIKALSSDTLSNILGREKGVDKKSIQALFAALGLTLEESDHILAPKETTSKLDPNFVGREGAIADLNNFVTQGEKIIVIQGEGGLGKSTLALHFLKTQNFDRVIEFYMAKETQNVSSVEGAIERWLRLYFNEEPGREFNVTLEQLRQQLRNSKQRIGILIDNLEPALNEKGKFIETHRNYVELLRVLADRAVQSVTLITTRECLRESAVEVRDYRLQGLDAEAWREFFNSRNLQTDTPALSAMQQSYGGNAKAMDILTKAIQYDFGGDIEAYWKDNNGDLLIHRDLEDLVVSQFDRLQHLDANAYRLLCRLGCYRYQDVPTVPIEGLLCLLWDVPEAQRRRVVRSLQERSLVELCDREYKLHPVIRAESVERLRKSDDRETANRKAAEFWMKSVKFIQTIQDAHKALEAYYHFIEINDLYAALHLIVSSKEYEFGTFNDCLLPLDYSLGNSFCRLGLLQPIIYLSFPFTNNSGIPHEYPLSQMYNLLGDLYLPAGYVQKAIECHKKSGEIAKECNHIYLQLSSLTNQGLCQIALGEFEEAKKFFEQVSFYDSGNWYNAKEDRFVIIARSALAFINSFLGLNQEAIKFAERVYKEFEIQKLGAQGTGYRSVFLSLAYKNLGYYEKSFNLYNKAILFGKQNHYTQLEAKALYGLAELYREQGDFITALSHHTESIELLEKIGAKCDLAEAYYQLALTYQKMGDTEKSQPNFQHAIQLFNKMEAPKQIEKVRRGMGNGENY